MFRINSKRFANEIVVAEQFSFMIIFIDLIKKFHFSLKVFSPVVALSAASIGQNRNTTQTRVKKKQNCSFSEKF